MSDLISRQAAIKALWKIKDERDSVYYTSAIYTAVEAIEALPSAETSIMTVKIGIDKERLEKEWKQALANSPLTAFSAESDTEEWIGGELGHTSKCGHEGCSSDIWDGCKDFYCPNCGRKVIWR